MVPLAEDELAAVERVLDGAIAWGAELDTRYRVLAATFEPRPERHPRGPNAPDRRLQALFYPVHTVLGVLRQRDPSAGHLAIQKFDVGVLVEVVSSFDGATVSAPLFDLGEPAADEWKPAAAEWSVEGRARTSDGRSHDVRLSLRGDQERAFDLYVTFDEVSLLDPNGEELDAPSGG